MVSFFSEKISTDTKFDSLIRVSWLILFAIAYWPYDIEMLSARAYLDQPTSFAVARKEASIGLRSFNTRKQGSIFHAVNDLLIGGAKGG